MGHALLVACNVLHNLGYIIPLMGQQFISNLNLNVSHWLTSRYILRPTYLWSLENWFQAGDGKFNRLPYKTATAVAKLFVSSVTMQHRSLDNILAKTGL